jgi:hypothetical protein
MPSIGQVYTTSEAQLKTGDWGVKHQLLATPVGARPGWKVKMQNMTLPEVDSMLGLPVWKSADKSARFLRMWGGEATPMRMKPERGQANWATDKGKVADPWSDQGERIVVSREYLHRQQQERVQAWRLANQPTDAEAEQQARAAFVRSAGLPAPAAEALFAELWSRWIAFIHAEDGEGATLASWIQKHGSAADFALELSNLRHEAEARASFFHPDSLANDPTEEDWETIIAHAQKRRMSLSNWEAVIRDLHEVGTLEDQAFDLFLREQAEARLPKSTSVGPDSGVIAAAREASVDQLVEALREDTPTGEAFVAFAAELKETGSSLAEWVEARTGGSLAGKQATPLNKFAVDDFLNPNGHEHLPDRAPDVERMTEPQFARYLESIKALQPKYRQHLLTKLAANTGAAAEPIDTTLRSLAVTDTLVPVKESKEFLRRHFAVADDEEGIQPARHPTGGLQYALPTKLEVASARPLKGYHLGKVQIPGSKDRTQDLHSIGGMVASGSPSNAIGGAGLKPLDLGLTSTGQWREEGRVEEDGKYFFRVDRAVLADPPKVVATGNEQRQPLEYRSISRGPDFDYQASYPFSIEVSRTDFSPWTTTSHIRTSPLEAYGRGEKFLGGRDWVSGKKAAALTASDPRKLQSYQTARDVVRGLNRP